MHVEICDLWSTMSPRTTTIFGPPHTGETMIVCGVVCVPPVLCSPIR